QGSRDVRLGLYPERAEDLDRVQTGLDRGLADRQLRERDLESALQALGLHGAGTVQEESRGVEAQLHVGNPVCDRLMARERLAELSPLLRERDALVELAIHAADVQREQTRALPRHRAVEDRRSGALLAEAGGLWHGAILEPHLAHRRAGQTDLVEVLAAYEAWRAPVDDERRDAQVAVLRLGRSVGQ